MTRAEQEQLAGLAAVALVLWWYFRRGTASVSTSYSVQGSLDSPIGRFAEAIAIAEGYYDGDTIARRANNPGNLKLGEPTIAAAGGNQITVFGSAAEGWAKLYRQLQLILDGGSAYYNRGTTIAQMGLTWSGGDRSWADNVAAVLNVQTSATLGTVLT